MAHGTSPRRAILTPLPPSTQTHTHTHTRSRRLAATRARELTIEGHSRACCELGRLWLNGVRFACTGLGVAWRMRVPDRVEPLRGVWWHAGPLSRALTKLTCLHACGLATIPSVTVELQNSLHVLGSRCQLLGSRACTLTKPGEQPCMPDAHVHGLMPPSRVLPLAGPQRGIQGGECGGMGCSGCGVGRQGWNCTVRVKPGVRECGTPGTRVA